MKLTPTYETDCQNLSPAALAKKYKLTFSSWKNMRQRCKGEGIFCHQQFSTFPGFLACMGPRTSNKYTLDRFPEIEGAYAPSNVRWADKQQQALNRTNAVKITYRGETLPIVAWAARLKASAATLRRRKRLRWSDEEIITGTRAGARKQFHPAWPQGDEQDWERLYKAHARNGESREKFCYRLCDERYRRLVQAQFQPHGEPIGIDEETGEPFYVPLPPAYYEHLEWVKRMLADAEAKLAAATRRDADPLSHLFRSPHARAKSGGSDNFEQALDHARREREQREKDAKRERQMRDGQMRDLLDDDTNFGQ